MCRFIVNSLFFAIFFAATAAVFAQDYKVIRVTDGGTIAGTVKWSGPVPRTAEFPITKDIQICDPDSKKTADLPITKNALRLSRWSCCSVLWPTM